MNIAIFSDTYLPDINGVAMSSHILKNELVKHGHHVLVVTTQLPENSRYIDEKDYILRLPGLDLKNLYGYRASSIYSFKGMQEIKDFEPNIVHIQTEFGIGIFGKIVGEILNIPVIYTYHTMYADYSHYINPINNKTVDNATKSIIEKISKIYGDSCSELIVPSQKTAEALKKYGISKNMHVIPTGLELDRFHVFNEENVHKIKDMYHLHHHFILTFLGRIASEKSVDMIIEAMPDIIKQNDNIRFMIVGDGPQLDDLKQLSQQLNMDDYIIFTGSKSPSDVPDYYHASSLFISASTSETQGLTYIEAMACHVPVLARYDKNLEEVIIEGKNGYFFNNQKELINRVISLSQMDLSLLSEHAYGIALQYSSEVFYKRIISVYSKSLLNHHYCYKVVSIELYNQNHYNVAFQFDNHQVILTLSKQVIDRYGLSIGQVVGREELDALKDQEQVDKAYHLALKYLTYKDYTYTNMKQKLKEKGNFDDIQIDITMELLVNKGLIDDMAYTRNYFEKSTKLGWGINKIIYNLKSQGVSPFVIDEFLVDYPVETEYDKAVEIIQKLYQENTTKPKYALIQNIKNKLFNKGFSQEIVEQATNDFDFVFPKENTMKLLNKEYERVYKRYKNRYDHRTLKSKIITFLVQKGYEYDDVIELMSEVWEDMYD
ncbi:MAG: RecX family transcriptional regulator [Erysipelotrichaceae bacterium]|nr:RecX family transcriptional regulator [Erysipelotrichaceae bacterium]